MIPIVLKINGQKIATGDIASTMAFPGLPEWKLGVISKWPFIAHVWFHEEAGWHPVSVDVFNSAGKGSGWLRGNADGLHFDLPGWTGRSFSDDQRVALAFGAKKLSLDEMMDGLKGADPQFVANTSHPEQNLTYITGSGNMRFWQPERAWVEWYGKTAAAAQWFNAYRAQDVLRPRWNLAKNGLPATTAAVGFNEWDQANGLNGWDSQHLDGQEECAGVVLFRSAPHMMAAVNLWNQVRYNSKSLAREDGQEYTGSSRVPGWYFAFAAHFLEALSACDSNTHLNLIRNEVIADVTWHLQNCLKIHPMVNPWYYGSFPAVKESKKDYWVPYQFAVKWWGCLLLVERMRKMTAGLGFEDPELTSRLTAVEGLAVELADRIHEHLVSCWLPAEQAFAYYMTVDRTMSEPMSVPGVASWMGPPSMLAKELDLASAPEFETVVAANVGYFGIDGLKASSVNLLRPMIYKLSAEM